MRSSFIGSIILFGLRGPACRHAVVWFTLLLRTCLPTARLNMFKEMKQLRLVLPQQPRHTHDSTTHMAIAPRLYFFCTCREYTYGKPVIPLNFNFSSCEHWRLGPESTQCQPSWDNTTGEEAAGCHFAGACLCGWGWEGEGAPDCGLFAGFLCRCLWWGAWVSAWPFQSLGVLPCCMPQAMRSMSMPADSKSWCAACILCAAAQPA